MSLSDTASKFKGATPPLGSSTDRRSALNKVIALLLSSPVLALVDQAIVSATRFFTTLIVGRLCGPEGLGIYVIAFAVVVASGLTQESLLVKPFQVFVSQFVGKRRKLYSGSVLVHHVGLILMVIAVSMVATLSLWIGNIGSLEEQRVALALAFALPGTLAWEFSRRYVMAQLQMGTAVIIDSSLAIIQISCLLMIGYFNELTVSMALLVLGGTGLVVGWTALSSLRNQFMFRASHYRRDMVKNWRFGRWIFAGQLIGLVQAYAIPGLLASTVGTTETGIVMACQTIVLLSNPFLLGVANWLGPATASAFTTGGVPAVTSMTIRSTVSLGFLMALFWLGLTVFGETLLVMSFGSQYAGHGNIVGITGLSALGFGITVGAASGLAAIRRPQLVMWGSVVGSLVSFVCFFPFTTVWGLAGAAWALGIGSLSTAIVHCMGYTFALRTKPELTHS